MQTREITRFLNSIQRDQDALKLDLNVARRAAATAAEQAARDLKTARDENARLQGLLTKLHQQLLTEQATALALTDASRAILPKLRCNVNQPNQLTPRWFPSTQRWWSRETGGLDSDATYEMTTSEIIDAMQHYAQPDVALILPASNRQLKQEASHE